MENIISEEQFQTELSQLAETNWKVEKLLKHFGSFEKLPVNIKNLIDKELNIERIEIMQRKTN